MRRSVRALGAPALLIALFIGLEARSQEKKADPPAPVAVGQQQDRIDIGNILDSWYRVIQKDTTAGYVHEVLQRAQAGNPWRYRYDADSEIELMLPDPKDPKKEVAHIESHRIRAQLDDTYAPLNMEWSEFHDEAQIATTVIADDDKRRIDVVLGSDRKSFPVSADEEVHYSRFLMFISLRQNGKLAKAGTQRALLFTPREDDKIPLSEVQLEVHEVVKREYMGKKDVSVTRVTYLKPPPAPTRDDELLEAFVDKFGRIVEETTRGGVRQLLVKDEVEAVGTKERVRPGARRDPFAKDPAMRPPAVGVQSEKGTTIDTRDIPIALKEIDKLTEDLKRAKDEKREDEGQKIYDKLLEYFSAVKKLPQQPSPAEQAALESKHRQIEEIWGGIERLMKKLQTTYVRVIEAFNNDECEQMEKGIEEIKKAQARKELEDQPQLAKVLGWIGELEPLVGKCKTRMELGRKKVVLTGTLLHEDAQIIPVDVSVNILGHHAGGVQEVRFIKPIRIAVINDKMYRVGDMVEGEGVRVEKIWAFGVQVSLREEVRDVGIRQK